MGAIALLAAVVMLQWLGLAQNAEAAVYWGNGKIGAANLDGSAPQFDYFSPPAPPHHLTLPDGVAVNQTHLYWQGPFGIGRVNLAGPPVVESVAGPFSLSSGLYLSGGLALGQSHVYWGSFQGNSIGRANLDGSDPRGNLVTGLDGPCGVAVDSNYVYWIDRGGIGRADLNGGDVKHSFIPAAINACGVAVDAQHIYWGDRTADGTIGRANLDGSQPDDRFIAGVGGVWGLAVDSDHLFWSDRPEGMQHASIGRANLDGTGANRQWIAGDSFDIAGVAVDARPMPPPVLLASRPVRLGKLRHNRRSGVVVLDVWVPERGELAVVAPRVGWKVIEGDPPPPWRGGTLRWRLKLWPGKSGRVGHRIRRQLRSRGRAPIRLWISYTEEGNFQPAFRDKRLAFRRVLRTHRRARAITRHWRTGSRRTPRRRDSGNRL